MAVTDVDSALLEACRGLARAVDDQPGRAGLWKEFLSALGQLRQLGQVGEDDGQAEILQLLRAPLGDAETA